MLFSFTRTRQPDPGTQAYAFESQGGMRQTIVGAGTRYLPMFNPIPSSQAYFPNVQGPMTGLGGLIFTSQYNAPLNTTG
jgi:hypothetical protein